jgi:hypothetical protein
MTASSKKPEKVRIAKATDITFFGLWLFIILVSVLDGFLALRYRHVLPAFERNPVGRALIVANGGRAWFLLIAKFTGTVFACTFLLLIYFRYPPYALIVCIAVAVVQLCLLLFLLLS